MKANLPLREPEILKFWDEIDLYQKLRKSNNGKENLFFMMGLLREWKYTYGNCIK